MEGDAWRAGATGKLLWGRRERDDAALRGLGDVRFGGEAGAFVEVYPLSWLRARAELRRGFLAHDAPMGDVKLDAFARIGERWIVAAGPRLSLAGGDHQRTYFGVDARQSAASGLPVFRPEGGVLSFGVAAQVTYQWTARLETTAYASANRLTGDAARSPLVTQRGSRDQFGAGVSTAGPSTRGFERVRRPSFAEAFDQAEFTQPVFAVFSSPFGTWNAVRRVPGNHWPQTQAPSCLMSCVSGCMIPTSSCGRMRATILWLVDGPSRRATKPSGVRLTAQA